jgi:hypothetical protein
MGNARALFSRKCQESAARGRMIAKDAMMFDHQMVVKPYAARPIWIG